MLQPNPFIITADYYGPEYFCDRQAETEALESNIANGRNTVLISSRRMGKSGLIAHVFNRAFVKSNFKTFSIDLYPTSSLAELILLLAKEITGPLKSKGQSLLESFLGIVKSLRPGFKVDPVTGQFVFDLSLGEIVKPVDSLKEIFQYLEGSEVPCLVSMDEFQQIAEYPDNNVLELLRTYVQKCKHTWFIFAGSDRRMMEKLFNNPSEPFYMSCSPLYLDAIQYENYLAFARHHFEAAGKSLQEESFKQVYELFDGHTWFVRMDKTRRSGRCSDGVRCAYFCNQDICPHIPRADELISGSAKATFDCHCQRWAGAAGYIRSLLQETFNEKPKHRAKRPARPSRQTNCQKRRNNLFCDEPVVRHLACYGVLAVFQR